jgi:serine/threonine protein kinase
VLTRKGVPELQWAGQDLKMFIIVIPLFGPNLEQLFGLCGKKFSLKTVLMLGLQCLERLEDIHSRDVIYCDVKPENLVMGVCEQSHLLHVIDFGLSKVYKDENSEQHVPYKEKVGLIGNARFASVNLHMGIEPSRRDDL